MLFQQEAADKTCNIFFVSEASNDSFPAPDLFIQTFNTVGSMQPLAIHFRYAENNGNIIEAFIKDWDSFRRKCIQHDQNGIATAIRFLYIGADIQVFQVNMDSRTML